VAAQDIVDLYWISGEEGAMPDSIRHLEATPEELVESFKDWYHRYLEIRQEDEEKKAPEERDLYPPERFR
jgi:hypothetical protein